MVSVTATLTLPNGEKSEFSRPVSTELARCDVKSLIDGLQIIQKEVNDNLTVLVDRDRAANGAGKDVDEPEVMEDDDDDDDDDDESDDSPPAEKKTKT